MSWVNMRPEEIKIIRAKMQEIDPGGMQRLKQDERLQGRARDQLFWDIYHRAIEALKASSQSQGVS